MDGYEIVDASTPEGLSKITEYNRQKDEKVKSVKLSAGERREEKL